MKITIVSLLLIVICVLLVILIKTNNTAEAAEPVKIIEKQVEIVEIPSKIEYYTSTELNEEVIRIIEGGGTQQIVDFFTLYTRDNKITIAIIEEAIRQKVPITAAFALAWGESRFKPKLVNRNGGHSSDWGLFQLNDSYRNWTKDEFFDVEKNTKEGLSYFSKCLVAFDYDLILSIAGYNKGLESIQKKRHVVYITLVHINNIIEFDRMLEVELNLFINRWKNDR
jgi:soluble lytic murein transglycosylase-like protein